jgi:glycosyltransferase involved in cell wall biosynthesis
MKCVFVITGLAAGGAENLLLQILTHADSLQGSTVITLSPGGELLPQFQAAGISVETLGMHSRVPSPLVIWRLARRLCALQADVVSTWMYHANLVGGLAARMAGIPVVWGIHNSSANLQLLRRSTRWVIRVGAWFSHWIPALIITPSEHARKLHVARHYAESKFQVIPNGIDLDKFKADPEARESVRRELGLQMDTPLVAMVARYCPPKDHAGFIQAAGLVAKLRPDVHFLLIGTGTAVDNIELQALIRQAGLLQNMHCLGLRTDVPRLTAALDVSCLASFGEAFGNVLGEALACGVPCVSSDVGVAAEMIAGAGKVVPVGNPQAFAQALLDVLQLDVAQRRVLAAEAVLRMLQDFEIGNIVKVYSKMLRNVTKRCSGDLAG